MSNIVDPDVMAHYEPSHQDLRCLQKSIIITCGSKKVILSAGARAVVRKYGLSRVSSFFFFFFFFFFSGF